MYFNKKKYFCATCIHMFIRATHLHATSITDIIAQLNIIITVSGQCPSTDKTHDLSQTQSNASWSHKKKKKEKSIYKAYKTR